ncbi:MAG: hypothetical protein AAGF97_02000 [Planctomycetota bacterium]
MSGFRGDLLLGGARLRALDGDLTEFPSGHEAVWAGEFRLTHDQANQVEVGRPYLLILDDGRGGKVELTDLATEEDGQALARFATPRLPR